MQFACDSPPLHLQKCRTESTTKQWSCLIRASSKSWGEWNWPDSRRSLSDKDDVGLSGYWTPTSALHGRKSHHCLQKRVTFVLWLLKMHSKTDSMFPAEVCDNGVALATSRLLFMPKTPRLSRRHCSMAKIALLGK